MLQKRMTALLLAALTVRLDCQPEAPAPDLDRDDWPPGSGQPPVRPEGLYLKAADYQDGHAGYSDPLDEQRFLVQNNRPPRAAAELEEHRRRDRLRQQGRLVRPRDGADRHPRGRSRIIALSGFFPVPLKPAFSGSHRVLFLTGRGRIPTFAERLPHTRAAVEYARRTHAGQSRGDGAPFVQHPLEVGALLHGAGASDQVIAAGVLHDVIEKGDVTGSGLEERFGPEITRLVLAVSDDPDIRGYAARKAALRRQVAAAGSDALTVFAADKLSKLRELRREMASDPSGQTRVRARRLRHYQRSLALLEERLPGSPLVQELRDELRPFGAAQIATAHSD
jgi:hypothetical protein